MESRGQTSPNRDLIRDFGPARPIGRLAVVFFFGDSLCAVTVSPRIEIAAARRSVGDRFARGDVIFGRIDRRLGTVDIRVSRLIGSAVRVDAVVVRRTLNNRIVGVGC